MSDGLYLGLDVGTQGTKAVVVDTATEAVIARSVSSYELIGGLPPGHAEQHPDTWLNAVQAVCADLWREGLDPNQIAAVGVSGQQHGLVVLDGAGAVLRAAKLWCDTSTAAEAEELSARLGHSVPTGFTASKVLWLARHEPAVWAQVATVLLPHDYINFALTGERCMEAGDASGTGFFDVGERRFDAAAVAAIDSRLSSMLPPVRAADAWAGQVTAAAAARFGLREGTPVSMGGGDNMMSAVGSGAAAAGVVVLSLGTSGTVFARTEEPVVDPEGLIAPFCGSVGGYLPLLCVMNCTGVAEEVVALTGLDHDALTASAGDVPAGCDGLLWLPYLAGERVPDLPNATGTILGMRPGHLRPGTLYRAALEGVSLNLAWGVNRMRALGVAVDQVHLVGGAANNPLWRQILADCIGAPVLPLLEAESAALGAALQARWAHLRSEGDGSSAAEVAAPFVRAGDATAPGPDRAACAALLDAFVAAVGV